jgi:hypothetical protein
VPFNPGGTIPASSIPDQYYPEVFTMEVTKIELTLKGSLLQVRVNNSDLLDLSMIDRDQPVSLAWTFPKDEPKPELTTDDFKAFHPTKEDWEHLCNQVDAIDRNIGESFTITAGVDYVQYGEPLPVCKPDEPKPMVEIANKPIHFIMPQGATLLDACAIAGIDPNDYEAEPSSMVGYIAYRLKQNPEPIGKVNWSFSSEEQKQPEPQTAKRECAWEQCAKFNKCCPGDDNCDYWDSQQNGKEN